MQNKKALTLIELIVAVAIFLTVITAIYSTFRTGVSAYQKTEIISKLYQQSRSVLDGIAKDLRNSFAYSDDDAGFSGSNSEVSFFSVVTFAQEEGSRMDAAKIIYKFESGKLKKLSLLNDAIFRDNAVPQIDFMIDAKDVKFQYAYASSEASRYEWKDDWQDTLTLPSGVKIILKLEDKASGRIIEQQIPVFIRTGTLGQ